MNSGNVEARLTAIEEQMQEIRAILQETAQLARETQQTANSNAKAIEANSSGIAELRVLLGETRQIADSNARAIESNSSAIAQGFQATQRDIQSLSQFMERFFSAQAQTNQVMQEGLEEHQQRLDRIDPDSGS
ncbi:hypothetical protein IFO70_32410 [Phormidium tenue FACHB-886]|nr:hypothetical protein [Phormidium tenue FACHB-886]